MRIPLLKRLIICICNVVFPPLAVGLLTGFTSHETLLNSILFLLAVIPSHIHGFWISAVYFTRKRRARNGKYPGKPHKWGIHSEKILTGGLGWEGAEDLKLGKQVEGGSIVGSMRPRSRNRASRRGSKRSGRSGRSRSREARQAADPYTDAQMREAQNVSRVGSQVSRTSRHF